LLKLVHVQRLLPLEELLSGVASGAPVRSAAPAPRASAPAAPPARPAAPPAAPAGKPASTLSPFGSSPFGAASSSGSSTSGEWGSTTPTIKQSAAPEPVVEKAEATPIETAAPVVAAAPIPAALTPPAPIMTAAAPAISPVTPFPAVSAAPAMGFAETLTEGSLAKAPSAAADLGEADVDTLCQAVVQALAQGGHQSASTLLGAGAWTIDGANLRIEVAGMGKKMLSLTVNAAAEKIIRQELQKAGGPARFMVVPGEGPAAGGGPAMAAPLAGSVQEEALNHPLVQRAKEIFKAEVRSVVDLRTK
jgi:DNA polymerase-3 subunit gamma/tau